MPPKLRDLPVASNIDRLYSSAREAKLTNKTGRGNRVSDDARFMILTSAAHTRPIDPMRLAEPV